MMSALHPKPQLHPPQPSLESLSRAAQKAFEPGAVQSAVKRMLKAFKERFPPNWLDTPLEDDLDVYKAIIDDGIPLVWIPRAEVVTAITEAEGRDQRLRALLDHKDEVVEDCTGCLGVVKESTDKRLLDWARLAQQAVDVLSLEYHAAAQALAVCVADAAVGTIRNGNRKEESVDWDDVTMRELRMSGVLGPLARFYTRWFPSDENPPPDALSRHVSVHHPRLDHYTQENAVLAVTLLCSLLREAHEQTR